MWLALLTFLTLVRVGVEGTLLASFRTWSARRRASNAPWLPDGVLSACAVRPVAGVLGVP